VRKSRLVLVIAALAVLNACAGKVRYASYYVLNVPPPPTVADRPKPILGSVAVREFTGPEFLREGAIAYRPSPEQLDFYSYHRWAEDPRRVVTAAMAREMQARGLFQSVYVFDGRGSSEYLVTGTIDHLEEVDRGRNVSIEVALSARLINVRTSEVLWQGALSKRAKLEQHSLPGIVAEMSNEVSGIVECLVSSMQERVSHSTLSLNRRNTEQ